MICPYCGREMIKGYVASSRDISFLTDDPNGKLLRIKKKDDIELTKGSCEIPNCRAYCCTSYKKILIDYDWNGAAGSGKGNLINEIELEVEVSREGKLIMRKVSDDK